MNTRAIVPIKLSLTEGDFYTLWAPKWHQNGSDWEAFLGNDEAVLVFNSPEELLAYLESGKRHDLLDHPAWAEFTASGDNRVVPAPRDEFDLIGLPAKLAERPGHEAVTAVSRGLEVAQSLANVAAAEQATIFFATHSILHNTNRGADHFSGPEGLREWSAIGRVIHSNWENTIQDLDGHVKVVDTAELSTIDAGDLEALRTRISAAEAAAEEARQAAEAEREAAQAAADPYDSSPWAAAGIDPLKITIDSQSTYTLRTYLDGKPVFLGKWGEIATFQTPKQLLRWIIEHHDHDLANVSTWQDLLTAANAGELEVTVHPDNQYSFAGISRDIENGPEAVDAKQLGHCYELCADAADWAADDSINAFMLANERFQDYLSYMLSATDHAGYVPTKPFTDHVTAWKGLEEMLIKRFSKF